MSKKKIMSVIAAAIILTTIPSCSAETDPSAQSSIVTSGPSVLSADTPLDTIVVSFNGNEDMNISFGDFLKEYKYYLTSYGIMDDTTAEYASTLTSRREYIANYLINGRIIDKKFTELGLTLTDEENAQIDAATTTGIDNIKKAFKERIKEEPGEDTDLSEEALTRRAEDEYNRMMEYCGLTEDDFRNWQREIVLQDKMVEHLNQDLDLEYSAAENQIQSIITESKANYEKDRSTYNVQSMSKLWIPDGTKVVKHILIKFDDGSIKEIAALRAEKKDEEADKLREERSEAMSARINEIADKISDGEDFDSLILEYSDDGDDITKYMVVPGTTSYMAEFTECALGIEQLNSTATCVTDYGYHFIKFTEAPEVTEEDIRNETDRMYEELCKTYKTNNFNKQMIQWREEYTFEIDRSILMLAEKEASAAE